MSVLSEILATKRTEVAHKREQTASSYLQERLMDAPPARNFLGKLKQADGIGMIAEVKKASPSKGVIREDFDPVEIARIYEANGASCLSVITDTPYFQGKLEYLPMIRDEVELPILRKGFIVDPWQILESRAYGADAILLIVAALPIAELKSYLHMAHEYGMTALVEVHDAGEMEEAIGAGAKLIGVNNRDLHTFRTTLNITFDLMNEYPPTEERLIVSESGIFTHADILKLEQAGVKAVLVGEALMREKDIAAKMQAMLHG